MAKIIVDTSELKDELHKAFCFLADLNPKTTKNKTPHEWKECFEASEASEVWKSWFIGSGLCMYEYVTQSVIPERLYNHALYNLKEVNGSNNYEYVLDITIDAIMYLYHRVSDRGLRWKL